MMPAPIGVPKRAWRNPARRTLGEGFEIDVSMQTGAGVAGGTGHATTSDGNVSVFVNVELMVLYVMVTLKLDTTGLGDTEDMQPFCSVAPKSSFFCDESVSLTAK